MQENRLAALRSELENRIKLFRRVWYQIGKTEFEEAFASAELSDQDAVAGLIRDGRERAVREWLGRRKVVRIEDMTNRQLYALGQSESIHDYKRIGTEALRAELIRLRDV